MDKRLIKMEYKDCGSCSEVCHKCNKYDSVCGVDLCLHDFPKNTRIELPSYNGVCKEFKPMLYDIVQKRGWL